MRGRPIIVAGKQIGTVHGFDPGPSKESPMPTIAPRPDRSGGERDIMHAIRVAVAKLPDVMIYRNNSGMLRDINGTPVRYGLGVGSADLVGLVTVGDHALKPDQPIARFFALEVKRKGKHPTEEQRTWLAQVIRVGGYAEVVHSVDEALSAIDRARKGCACRV